MAIDPRGLSLRAWADATILSVGDGYSLGRLDDLNEWKSWGLGLVRASPFTQRSPPNPYQFNDWREFAERIYTMLEDVT